MNNFIRQYLNYKINNLQVNELLDYARQYQVPVTRSQALKIIKVLRREKIDIGNEIQRERIVKQILKESGADIKIILEKLLKQYK